MKNLKIWNIGIVFLLHRDRHRVHSITAFLFVGLFVLSEHLVRNFITSEKSHVQVLGARRCSEA